MASDVIHDGGPLGKLITDLTNERDLLKKRIERAIEASDNDGGSASDAVQDMLAILYGDDDEGGVFNRFAALMLSAEAVKVLADEVDQLDTYDVSDGYGIMLVTAPLETIREVLDQKARMTSFSFGYPKEGDDGVG